MKDNDFEQVSRAHSQDAAERAGETPALPDLEETDSEDEFFKQGRSQIWPRTIDHRFRTKFISKP